MFPCLQDVVENILINTGVLLAFISQQLKEMSISFDQYLPQNENVNRPIRNG